MFKTSFLVILLFNAIYWVENRPPDDKDAIVFKQTNEGWDLDTGRYSYSFETSNGIKQEESGIVFPNDDNRGTEVEGSYSFISPEGRKFTVVYIAGKDGYQASMFEDNPSEAMGLGNRISGKLLESLSG